MARSVATRAAATPRFVEIGWLARELGVAPSTLRSWERRYKLVVPHRGDQGQRLYDRNQIALLRRVLKLIHGGARASAAHSAVAVRRPIATQRLTLHPTAQTPAAARNAIDELLGSKSDPKTAFYARLLASELITNAVVHGSDQHPITLEAQLYEDGVELTVQNAGGRLRIKSLRRRSGPGGRGLEIVDALADSWSITTGAFGTTIWVRLPNEPNHEDASDASPPDQTPAPDGTSRVPGGRSENEGSGSNPHLSV